MADSSFRRTVPKWPLRAAPDAPGLVVNEIEHWSPPAGLDYHHPVNRVDVQHCSEISNFYLDNGVFRTRAALGAVGSENAGFLTGVVNFVTAAGTAVLIRFTKSKAQRWNSTLGWIDIPGANWAGADDQYFSTTAYGDTLLWSSRAADAVWEYQPVSNTVFKNPSSPAAAHITTFGGRVIASGILGKPFSIQWTVKNNSRDWIGIGSGIEDLKSTPGGEVDEQMGVYPVSSSTALAVRGNSVWLMTETGDPKKPYRFDTLHPIGSRSPRTIARVTGGIMMLGTDDVYIVTEQTATPIGELIRKRLIGSLSNLNLAAGGFISSRKEYWIAADKSIYIYSFYDKGWSRQAFPWTIDNLWPTNTYFGEGLTIDQLTGTIDSLVGTIDSLVGQRQSSALHVTSGTQVMTEDDSLLLDIFSSTSRSQIATELRSGVLEAGDVRSYVKLLEVLVEYECTATQLVTLEYSTDGGKTWLRYSQQTLQATTKPEVITATRTIKAQSIQVRLITSSLTSRLSIISMLPRTVKEARARAR